MGWMDGKVSIITGGAGSLGLATAKLFYQEGGTVMLVDLNEEDLQKAAAEIDGADRVGIAVGDVSQAVQVKAFVDATMAKWGKIDCIFSNAGNRGEHFPIGEFPEDNFDSVWAVHVKGAFLCAKYGLPKMSNGGSFIITSSVAGQRGAAGGAYAYAAAKVAQIGLMTSLAKEMGKRNIRVNALLPGPIDNPFQAEVERLISIHTGRDATKALNDATALGRHVSPEEVARSVLYLASDLGSYTSGIKLAVDGGMLAPV